MPLCEQKYVCENGHAYMRDRGGNMFQAQTYLNVFFSHMPSYIILQELSNPCIIKNNSTVEYLVYRVYL